MRAGTLRDRIKLQRPRAGASGSDWGPQTAFDNEGDVWASVLATAGKEAADVDTVSTVTSFTIRIRYRSDVDSAWRVLWGNKTLDIVDVIDPTGRKAELVITASEGPADA